LPWLGSGLGLGLSGLGLGLGLARRDGHVPWATARELQRATRRRRAPATRRLGEAACSVEWWSAPGWAWHWRGRGSARPVVWKVACRRSRLLRGRVRVGVRVRVRG